ncbi:MAG: tetratricopeptide repeat protein, partial [Planctomycetota bacterium]|nr:tetratricopeptide repeat protein [Planctomycetota bacterium]
MSTGLRMGRGAIAAFTTALVVSLAGAALAQDGIDPVQRLQDEATAAFDREDYAAARDALLRVVQEKPRNPAVLYNLACALAQTGEIDAAEARLVEAISNGFVDFHHLADDPHLAPLRFEETYQAIMLGWRELLDARADANLETLQERFGGQYVYERDESLRLVYAAAFDAQTFAEAREEVVQVATWAFGALFGDLGFDDAALEARPDPWVSVILPTPEDFMRMVRMVNIGGFYDHDHRRLISQDIGPSFRHEFFHVLHWRDMARRDQRHPEWIMEGLAALVED